MIKSFAIFRCIACLICLLFLFGGCEKQAESTKNLQAVRKKIVVPKKEVQQPQTVKPMPSKPAKAVSPVTDIAKTARPVTEPKPTVAATDGGKMPLESKKTAAVSLGKPEKDEVEEEDKGKIDPFAPLFKDEPVKKATRGVEKKVTKKRIPLTPLEKIDLSQLKLVGIIQAPSGNKALVEEASGKGYIVAKGTYIGLHSGRILEILGDRIIVEEEVEDILGKVTIDRKELKIQKPPGEF
jgi:type IV pilus assembly protein PilP